MRLLIGLVAVLALAGCDSTGKPSSAVGSALDGFRRGWGDGPRAPAPITSPPAQRYIPAPVQPPSAQAFFTGRSQQVQTVTGGMAWQCEYNYAGQTFALLFTSYCPSSAPVR
jgi:hypothetical protein